MGGRARVHLGPSTDGYPGSQPAGCLHVNETRYHVQAGHMPFLPHQPQALGRSVIFPTLLLVPKSPVLAHAALARLLVVLAKIRDAGTPHRKEPAGYTEAGPSGPQWGPVRLTCATCPQIALSGELGVEEQEEQSLQSSTGLPTCQALQAQGDAVGGWGWEGR